MCGTNAGTMPIEGYLGNNKLLLVVEPKYAKTAMEIYQDMDKKKFFRAAVLDTKSTGDSGSKEGALRTGTDRKRAVCAGVHQFLPRKCHQM